MSARRYNRIYRRRYEESIIKGNEYYSLPFCMLKILNSLGILELNSKVLLFIGSVITNLVAWRHNLLKGFLVDPYFLSPIIEWPIEESATLIWFFLPVLILIFNTE